MASKIVLGVVFDSIFKDLMKVDADVDENSARYKAHSKIATILGDEWTDLPVTGPRMMVLLFALNIVLAPMGIVPALIIDRVIDKARELELDPRISDFGDDLKVVGVTGIEKIKGLSPYFDQAKINIKEILPESDTVVSNVKSFFKKGKNTIGSQLSNFRSKKETKDSEEK